MALGTVSRGLVHNVGRAVRCDRCDLPLSCSTWKDKQISYSVTSNHRDGFLCVRCSTRNSNKNKASKPRVTIEELDEYLARLLRIS